MALVILDRDGVINRDSDAYIRSPAEWLPIPGSLDAIARLSRAGCRVVIATNQSGLGRGYFSRATLEEIHARLCEAVAGAGGEIAGIFYCPHRPEEGCECRKPRTGLLLAIERELAEPVAGAWFVGDSLKDLQAAEACGCRPALVTTGKGAATARELARPGVALRHPQRIPVFADLAAAVDAILAG